MALNKNLLALGTAKHGVALIDLHSGGLAATGYERRPGRSHVYNLAYDHNGGLWLALDEWTFSGQPEPAERFFRGAFQRLGARVVGTRDEHLLFGGTFFAIPGGVQQLTQAAAQILKFPYTYNAFRFDYSANGLQATGDMEFQTYVQGVDTDWTSGPHAASANSRS